MSAALRDPTLDMCLAATKKGIIISANLLAALLLIQPSVWSALVAARVPCWPLLSLSTWIPSSFLLVTLDDTAAWGYPGTPARLRICLCWILQGFCQASLPVCPDAGEWQPYAPPLQSSPSLVSSTNRVKACPPRWPDEAVLTLIQTHEGCQLKLIPSWTIRLEPLTVGPEPLDHNDCIWSLMIQLVFHPASKNYRVSSSLTQSLHFGNANLTNTLVESWTVEQKLFVL